MSTDPMAEIRDTFFQECEEQLAELEAGLIRMQEGSADADTVNAVFRAVHSIKGGAGIFSLDDLVRFAHAFETTLDAIRSDRLASTSTVMSVLLRAADELADLTRAGRQGTAHDNSKGEVIIADLKRLTDPDAAPPQAPATPPAPAAPPAPQIMTRTWQIKFKPLPELYAKGNETLLLLRELGRLGDVQVAVDAEAIGDLSEIDPDGAYLAWTLTFAGDGDEAEIREVFEFVEDDCELLITELASAPAAADDELEGVEGFVFFGVSDDAPAEAPAEPAAAGDELEGIEGFVFFGAADTEEAEAAVAEASPPAPTYVAPEAAAAAPAANAVEAMAAKADSGAAVSATIRVDLDRVDRLIDLVGELVINEAMLSQRVLEAGIARGSAVAVALEELEHLTRDIQDSVMAIRAQPVRSVFQRMPRLVRELAQQTGKQVRLVMEGEGTEVDKTVIERISDPLTHMIRNAIDHGLERTEDRLAAGKPAEGTVKLNALHRSGRIVLEVSDDGAGINRARVKAKAIERGLLAADAALTDEEIDNLIFLPGFSTASTISNISGRGVGMDVVRQSVQALGGRISIASQPGLGSTFTLSLPLTLAVLDGMVVRAGGHTLIIPLGTIIETLKPKADQVHQLGTDLKVMLLRGGYIPVVDVANVLGLADQPLLPENSVALMVEGDGGARSVLLVDAIDGQRQVVIKSLEANYRAVPGIAAATVMGNGRVALILDVDAIVSAQRIAVTRLEKLKSPLLEVSTS
jgi:two-component system chemotaxis sensor kinase CheA